VTPAAAAHDFAKSLAYATARAVVDEIVANAEVSGSDIT
jgi:hypothetical protein